MEYLAEINNVNTYSKEPAFKKADPFSVIQEVAGILSALAPNNQIFTSGSCVRIAPNLYLTAKHVLTDFIDKFGFENNGANFIVWIAHIYKGPEYAIWEMDTFWLSTHTDLAVFHVKPLNDTAVNQAVVRTVGLDLQPPTVGSRVNGWGQRNSSSAISIKVVACIMKSMVKEQRQ